MSDADYHSYDEPDVSVPGPTEDEAYEQRVAGLRDGVLCAACWSPEVRNNLRNGLIVHVCGACGHVWCEA